MLPSSTTSQNYTALIASVADVAITKTTGAKTQTCYVAEISLISAMSFMLVVASTHFVLDIEEDIQVRQDMREASTGVKQLYNIVVDYYNLPVFPIKPQYIFSSDDTVVYTYEGKRKDSDEFRLVARKSLNVAGTSANYMHDDSNHICGMRVKLTFAFSAIGTCAPLLLL